MTEPAPKRPKKTAPAPSIPGYRIDSVIGRGATGVVYRARQLVVDREVALKVLHPELSGKTRTIGRLQREARTTARLAHPHIVTAIDMGETGGRWWYAMELVDGPSLALRLRQEGRLGEREALRLFIPLCEALVHMWEHGVVHRDIKPANILIDRAGGARLADLGLAFADDDPLLTTSDGTLGTPHYMSPEQARDPASADIRSDLWSLGATMFHSLCGRPPFSGDSSAEVLSGVLYASIPDPHRLEPELSRGLVLVLRKCLSRSPDRRYQTPAELLEDLERVRERRRPKVRSAALDPVESRLPAWSLWVAGAAALALVAAVTWTLATRPWADRGESSRWAELERLERLELRGGRRLAEVLAGIDALRPPPAAHVDDYHESLTRVKDAIRSELEVIERETEALVSSRLADYDYVGALNALGSELNARLLERTGYSLERLPPPEFGFQGWHERAKSSVEGDMASRIEYVAREMERLVEDVVLPKVAENVAAKRWRSAGEILDPSLEALARNLGFRLDGLAEDDVEGVLERIRSRLATERAKLAEEWRRVDADLVATISAVADELEEALENRTRKSGSIEFLRGKYFGELSARGLTQAEMPEGPLRIEAELERRISRLRDAEDKIRFEEASKGFDVFDTVTAWLEEAEVEALMEARDYRAAAQRWATFRARTEELPLVDESKPWRERLAGFVARRVDEAERLAALLDRAAKGVLELEGREETLSVGQIGYTGTVSTGAYPLRDGFALIAADGGTRDFRLQTMSPIEVERLAGLPADDSAIEAPEDRLARAWFRFREGQVGRAARVLESGELPVTGIGEELALELRYRLELTGELTRDDGKVRRLEAKALLKELDVYLRDGKAALARRRLDQLVSDYGDLPEIASELDRLRSRLATIAAPVATDARGRLDKAYRPLELALNRDSSSFEMAWDFGEGRGEWRTLDWIPNGAGGMSPSGNVERFEDLGRQHGLRLSLLPPIEFESKALTVSVDFGEREDQARLTVLSVAGYHLALVGPNLPGSKGYGWKVSAGGVGDLLGLVQDGEVEAMPERVRQVLASGEAFTVRITIHRERGNLRVEVGTKGGEMVDVVQRTVPPIRSTGEQPAGSRSVAILAWERVNVTAAEIVGSYTR